VRVNNWLVPTMAHSAPVRMHTFHTNDSGVRVPAHSRRTAIILIHSFILGFRASIHQTPTRGSVGVGAAPPHSVPLLHKAALEFSANSRGSGRNQPTF